MLRDKLTPISDEELAERSLPDDNECQCAFNEQRDFTLLIEEGQAVLRHEACGKRHWTYPEDYWVEIPVTVDIKMCNDPGGWHGMERCECGPELTIKLRTEVMNATD